MSTPQQDSSEIQVPEPRTSGTESSPGAGDTPLVAAARVQADANMAKARTERSTATDKDLWIIGVPTLITGFGTVILLALGLGNSSASGDEKVSPFSWWWFSACVACCIALIVVFQVRAASRRSAYEKVVSDGEFNVRMAELEYRPDIDAPMAANRELLQRYHMLSTGQANAAFKLAAWVMGAAAFLALLGSAAAALVSDTTTTVSLASVTAVISALGGYISSTLLATYRVSVEQARFYFREPLAGGYLLAAEHLAKRLDPPEHTAALGRVVDGFIQAATNVPGAAPDSATQGEPPQDTPAAS
ncbi:hypothetical protein ABZ402_50370 [Streptomyces mirabilis]|uniref:hypothetical protein n=1 Tax=Streptomyces mirabilis TaxID=68239 RepID=UPI0033F8F02C